MHDLTLTAPVRERIGKVHEYIAAMAAERMGWGPDAERETADTMRSFIDGFRLLCEATEVWIDGGAGYSFGGVLPGGIVFGMIARTMPARSLGEFANPPLEWTFHS
jgi:hypothetical protein